MKKHLLLAKLLQSFMVMLMGVALMSLVGLPWIVNRYLDYAYSQTGSMGVRIFFLVVLYISGLLALVVLYELRKIFHSCVLEDPFIERNVVSLKRIGLSALIICLIFIAKATFLITFLTLIVIFVFALAAAFCFVLADVFEVAVDHKNEIDLTI